MTPRTSLTRISLSAMTLAAAITVIAVVPASASPAKVSCKRWQALHVTGANDQPYVIRNKPSTCWPAGPVTAGEA